VAGQAIRGGDEHGLEGALRSQIPQTVEPRTVQVRPAAALVDEDVGGRHLIAALRGRPSEAIELAVHGLLLLLTLGGDPRVDGGDLQRPVEACGLASTAGLVGDGGGGPADVRPAVLRSRSKSSMAFHTRLLASQHGTLTPSIRSLCGSPSPPAPDPMHPPPSRTLQRKRKCMPIRRSGGRVWSSQRACYGRAR
jgi:hypothetical protein